MRNSLLLIFLCVSAISCRKEPAKPIMNPPATETGLQFTFKNMVGNEPLELQTKSYKNTNGDDFFVDVYRYYISNIVLTTATGEEYKEPESYHLIDHSKGGSLSFKIEGAPTGEYSKISFLIGVDSARNVSGAQTGALNPTNNMFWDWNSGYIMAMFEGRSAQSGFDSLLSFHMAGFSGKEGSIRAITLQLPEKAIVSNKNLSEIVIKADVAEWFTSPNTISFNQTYIVVGGPEAKMIADNYADMFSISHIHNNQ